MAKKLHAAQVRIVRSRSPARGRLPRTGAPWAITGTPGTGKSRLAKVLAPRYRSVEVHELARARGCAREVRGGWEVDLVRLRRSLARHPTEGIDLVVGHLAHLLPVEGAVVLRCHPVVLRRRLDRARRGTPHERDENALAEALDLVASEVRARRLPFWELDTTGRSIRSVAADAARGLRARKPPRPSPVHWLADRSVTAHLLEWQP